MPRSVSSWAPRAASWSACPLGIFGSQLLHEGQFGTAGHAPPRPQVDDRDVFALVVTFRPEAGQVNFPNRGTGGAGGYGLLRLRLRGSRLGLGVAGGEHHGNEDRQYEEEPRGRDNDGFSHEFSNQ